MHLKTKQRLQKLFATCATLACISGVCFGAGWFYGKITKPQSFRRPDIFLNPAAFEAQYKREAYRAFINAHKNGLIKSINTVATIKNVNRSEILTLTYFESGAGANLASKTTSARGIVQYTKSSFLERIARHGMRIASELAPHEPQAAARLKSVARNITRDPQTGKITLHNKLFKKRNPKDKRTLEKAALDLRNGKKNQTIALLFAFDDLEEALPRFKKQIKGKESIVIRNLINKKGDRFLKRLIHNWGFQGAYTLVTHQNAHQTVGYVMGRKIAAGNRWRCVPLMKMFTSVATSYDVVQKESERLFSSTPKPPQTKTIKAGLKQKTPSIPKQGLTTACFYLKPKPYTKG